MIIENHISNAISDLVGKRSCRQRVGRGRSLSLGFGEKISHTKLSAVDQFYGAWEIGTYSSAWRVVRNKTIVCGSLDTVDSIDELDQRLRAIEIGAITSVEQLSDFDVRVSFDKNIRVEFLWSSIDDDECFHIFGPGDLYVEFSPFEGWKIGNSKAPWS